LAKGTRVLQPYLHDLVSCVAAPTVVLSGADGQIRPVGVHGMLTHDLRVLSALRVTLDGEEPVAIGHALRGGGTAVFTTVIRHLGDPGPDPTVRLIRERVARADGLTERLTLINDSRDTIRTTLAVDVDVDFAPIGVIKQRGGAGQQETTGLASALTADSDGDPRAGSDTDAPVQFDGEDAGVTVTAHPAARIRRFAAGKFAGGETSGTPEPAESGQRGPAQVAWDIELPSRQRWTAEIDVHCQYTKPTVVSPPSQPVDIAATLTLHAADDDLVRFVEQSLADLSALVLADPEQPEDRFFAAGVPWYLTLFGRDSLWAARMTLPLGTELAAGTLRTLARRQGRRLDRETLEAPGRIMHEIRGVSSHSSLPPVYYGTIDATALWVQLLHDAWRWGMPEAEVAALLPNLRAALEWLTGPADSDGDGFLEYIDLTGRGLANQGWKDSGDSIQWPDGRIATPPIALCEAQAYAHQAAVSAAALLQHFGESGADELLEWAAEMRRRFRERFWVSDERGRFPAIALDRDKQPVPVVSSNLGHLLGTGLLDADEAAQVAARLASPDMDCGYGLRTFSSRYTGYNPIGYHVGSVWPHDTAIAVSGLASEGHGTVAAALATGVVRAAASFGYRLPELYAGNEDQILPYPAACRPQAWSSAAAVEMLRVALGLTVDVPGSRLSVRPDPAFAAWFPLRVHLRIAGHPVEITVDTAGKATVNTSGPFVI